MTLISSIKNSYYLKSGIYSFSQRFSGLVFGFGAFYFLVRLYSTGEHGTWVIYFTTATIAEMSRNGLIQNSLIKYLHSSQETNKPKLHTASLALNLSFSICLFILLQVVGVVFLRDLNLSLYQMLTYYGINLLMMVPFSHLSAIQMANLNFKGIFFAGVTRQGFFFMAVLYLFIWNTPIPLYYLVVLQAVGISVGVIVSFVFGRKYLFFSRQLEFSWVKKLFQYGKYVMGTNISSMIFKTTDQYMLGALVSVGSTSIYNAALRVSNLVEYPSTSIADVIFPKSVQRINAEGTQAAKKLYEKSVGVILAIIVPLILPIWIFSDEVMLFIAGPSYQESGDILKVIILFGLITPYNRQFGMIMDAIGKPQLNFRLLLFTTVINLGSNIAFIRVFGTIGAAYGTLFSYTVNFVLNQMLLSKMVGVSIWKPIYYMIEIYGSFFKKLKSQAL